MTELLTASAMRAIEKEAIGSGQSTGLELMERAGACVIEAVFEAWPTLAGFAQKAFVLCGPGNNGGDGYVIARLLHERGWEVTAALYGEPDALPPDARANYDRWGEIGEHKPLSERSFGTVQSPPDLVVDALFGTGLSRPIADLGATLLDLAELRGEGAVLSAGERPDWTPLIVAVDLPSRLCSDSGRVLRDEHFVGLPEVLEAASVAAGVRAV